jgi:fructokinase
MIIGGLEAGGTKMVCAIGNEKGELIKRVAFKTRTPKETIPELINFYKNENIEALGIGSFGPIDLDEKSKTFGVIGNSPKVDWVGFNIYKAFKESLLVEVGIDTDVNGAALGEVTWGAAKDAKIAIYITIGTGIGVGVCVDKKPLHGLTHLEAGHIIIRKDKRDDFEGVCPYHGDCFEGLASGPAIEKRWKDKAYNLSNNNKVWDLQAEYISQALVNYILTLSPNKIILWGGVMHQNQLFDLIRQKVQKHLNSYIKNDYIENNIEKYIIAPMLGDDAGIKGALRLGYLAKKQAI